MADETWNREDGGMRRPYEGLTDTQKVAQDSSLRAPAAGTANLHMALAGWRDVGGRSGTAATDDFQAESENPRRERTAEEADVFMLLREP